MKKSTWFTLTVILLLAVFVCYALADGGGLPPIKKPAPILADGGGLPPTKKPVAIVADGGGLPPTKKPSPKTIA